MKDRRLSRRSLFLVLSTAVLVAFGEYFLLAHVPQIVSNERARVESEARRMVDEIRSGERDAAFVWEYGIGVVDGEEAFRRSFPAQMLWKDWEMSAVRKGQSMWGVRRSKGSDEAVVWVRDGKRVLAAVAYLPETDFGAIFLVGGSIVLLLIVAAAFFAIASIHSYAKSRDDFLAAAAHDLTTPLVGMRYLIGRNDEDARNLNERMIRLVENIRDFLSLGGRRKRPGKDVFAVGEAFDSAYGIFAADYKEETSGPIEVLGDKGIEVCADEELLTQILWNLLGNDLKYAAPFGRVSVRFEKSGDCAKISFIDEGQGMTRSQMRHAFDRYWRAKTVLSSGKGGFGIGLCTSREFARAMGGDLSVAANSPKGCIFTLTVPLAGNLR
jgi:signal transduction histidine kinase